MNCKRLTELEEPFEIDFLLPSFKSHFSFKIRNLLPDTTFKFLKLIKKQYNYSYQPLIKQIQTVKAELEITTFLNIIGKLPQTAENHLLKSLNRRFSEENFTLGWPKTPRTLYVIPSLLPISKIFYSEQRTYKRKEIETQPLLLEISFSHTNNVAFSNFFSTKQLCSYLESKLFETGKKIERPVSTNCLAAINKELNDVMEFAVKQHCVFERKEMNFPLVTEKKIYVLADLEEEIIFKSRSCASTKLKHFDLPINHFKKKIPKRKIYKPAVSILIKKQLNVGNYEKFFSKSRKTVIFVAENNWLKELFQLNGIEVMSSTLSGVSVILSRTSCLIYRKEEEEWDEIVAEFKENKLKFTKFFIASKGLNSGKGKLLKECLEKEVPEETQIILVDLEEKEKLFKVISEVKIEEIDMNELRTLEEIKESLKNVVSLNLLEILEIKQDLRENDDKMRYNTVAF